MNVETQRNIAIQKFNQETHDEQMKALMGADVWAKHKPNVNLCDLLSNVTNDNVSKG